MLEMFSDFIYRMNDFVWGPVTVVLLVGTGLYLTIRLRFIQLRYLKHAVMCISGKYDDVHEKGDISHFQALCSALSATIGTGNIVGVATAIALGGPGAIFWMWVTALVGMATKFTSCSLALRFRTIHKDGSASGGPMYYLDKGLHMRWLGIIFALFASISAFGTGCAIQANSVAESLINLMPAGWQHITFSTDNVLLGNLNIFKPVFGVVLAVAVGLVTIGGIKRIAKVATRIVPVMCIVYVTAALICLALNVQAIPAAFKMIFCYAFTPLAAGGGFFGFVLSRTIEKGVARGVLSNESGLGSAPMAHAAAKTTEMAREGFVAMLGPFIDTIIICTMTALVIITSGVWQVHAANGELLYGPGGKGLPIKTEVNGTTVQVVGTIDQDNPQPILDENGKVYLIPTGATLTAGAFEQSLPKWGGWIVSISLIFFAYSTIIAWCYYGDRCCEYLLGSRAVMPYRYLYCVAVVLGAIGGLDLVWTIADNFNALMAIPNLIALIGLAGVARSESKSYLARMRNSGQV